ncbi:MAG: phosphotransferase family protein [bacterium]|nr:phosphotransferase family protein [bacterium]MCP5067662.1 phosphotransferase family protein [bacterium]
MDGDPRARAANLSCWSGPVLAEPVGGGITNSNFRVEDGGKRYFVRIGSDIPRHGIMRFHELAASRGAHAAGVSPEVLHDEEGAMVLQYIEGRTLRPEDICEPTTLERIVPLIKRCHTGIPMQLRGPAMVFWVFHVVRDYAHTLREDGSRMLPALARLIAIATRLELAVGPVSLVFGHNDLLAANFIDDGHKIWLIDWDYAGFNSPLFDLGGLASNNELPAELEEMMLQRYFEEALTNELRASYAAMKCASLLREAMWSMVSEHDSRVDFDFVAYTDMNLQRFEEAWAHFEEM